MIEVTTQPLAEGPMLWYGHLKKRNTIITIIQLYRENQRYSLIVLILQTISVTVQMNETVFLLSFLSVLIFGPILPKFIRTKMIMMMIVIIMKMFFKLNIFHFFIYRYHERGRVGLSLFYLLLIDLYAVFDRTQTINTNFF